MSTIPWLADLGDLPLFETAFLILFVIVACMAAGFLLDAAMKNLGLGPFANAIIALIGVFAGIYLRYRLIGSRFGDDAFLTLGFGLGFALLVFLGIALVRSRGL
jgi:hypothetical protein